MHSFRRAKLFYVALAVCGGGNQSYASTSGSSLTVLSLPNSAVVEIQEDKFVKTKAIVEGCLKTSHCLINSYLVFGCAFGLPSTFISAMNIIYKKRKVSIDVRGMFDAWGSRPLQFSKGGRYFGGSCLGDSCRYRGLFSDGEGTFVAEWVVAGNKSFRTIISDDPAVIRTLSRNIDGDISLP